MDNDNKFQSPMVASWAFQIAHMKGQLPATPLERAKRAVDYFLQALRNESRPHQVTA